MSRRRASVVVASIANSPQDLVSLQVTASRHWWPPQPISSPQSMRKPCRRLHVFSCASVYRSRLTRRGERLGWIGWTGQARPNSVWQAAAANQSQAEAAANRSPGQRHPPREGEQGRGVLVICLEAESFAGQKASPTVRTNRRQIDGNNLCFLQSGLVLCSFETIAVCDRKSICPETPAFSLDVTNSSERRSPSEIGPGLAPLTHHGHQPGANDKVVRHLGTAQAIGVGCN